MAIKPEPGMTFCSTWDVTDYQGETITVGFVARACRRRGRRQRAADLPRDELAREREGVDRPPDHLAQRILDGLAQPGVHRALVDPVTGRC